MDNCDRLTEFLKAQIANEQQDLVFGRSTIQIPWREDSRLVNGRRHLCNLRHNGARELGQSGEVRRGPPVAKSTNEEHAHDRLQQVRPPGL